MRWAWEIQPVEFAAIGRNNSGRKASGLNSGDGEEETELGMRRKEVVSDGQSKPLQGNLAN